MWLKKAGREKVFAFGSPLAQKLYRRASLRFPLAAILAAFPFLFVVDEKWAFGFSPVLPGLFALMVVGAFTPLLLLEMWRYHARKRDPETVLQVGLRRARIAKFTLAISSLWLFGWFTLGVA